MRDGTILSLFRCIDEDYGVARGEKEVCWRVVVQVYHLHPISFPRVAVTYDDDFITLVSDD